MPEITKDTIIGDVVTLKVGADKVLKANFGEGCFTCPAATTEPLQMAAAMHGIELNKILSELNSLDDNKGTEPVQPITKFEKKSFTSWLLGK